MNTALTGAVFRVQTHGYLRYDAYSDIILKYDYKTG